MAMTTAGTEPSEVELLLPWHAAGALNDRDTQQLEAALAADPELASRYEWVCDELAEATHDSEMMGEPSGHDAAMLFAKIDAEPARRRAASAGFGAGISARISDFFAALAPQTLAWSAAAAALAIVLQAGLIGGIMFRQTSPGGYQTASAPANVTGAGAYALVRFRPQATASDIAAFLATNKIDIVGGPAAGGLYRVRIAPTKLANADQMRLIKALQADKNVDFIAATQ
jgi:hypothetical protein